MRSEDERKGVSFRLYDRIQQRILIFPANGHLALPDDLTNDVDEFGLPVPPYDFVFRKQDGKLGFKKPSQWVY